MSLIHFCLDIWKSTLHQTAVEDISLCGLPWLLPGLWSNQAKLSHSEVSTIVDCGRLHALLVI